MRHNKGWATSGVIVSGLCTVLLWLQSSACRVELVSCMLISLLHVQHLQCERGSRRNVILFVLTSPLRSSSVAIFEFWHWLVVPQAVATSSANNQFDFYWLLRKAIAIRLWIGNLACFYMKHTVKYPEWRHGNGEILILQNLGWLQYCAKTITFQWWPN